MSKGLQQLILILLIPFANAVARHWYMMQPCLASMPVIPNDILIILRIYNIEMLLGTLTMVFFIKKFVEPIAKYGCDFWIFLLVYKVLQEIIHNPTQIDIMNYPFAIVVVIFCIYKYKKSQQQLSNKLFVYDNI